jgi:cytochrome P450
VTDRVLSMRDSDPVPFPTIASPQLRHDPALDEWRRDEPVRRIQLPYGRWCWVVTRHADVKLVLTDPRFSRRAAGKDDAPRKTPGVVQRGSLASMDGADHARLRRLVSRALTVRRMEALRPRTEQLVGTFLDSMAANGPRADLLTDLAMPVPIAVICELLGIPYDDRARFRGWAEQLLSTAATAEGSTNVTEVSIAHLWAYLGELIAARRRAPTDDLLSALIAARDEGDALTEDEMVWLAFTMLAGGFETTGHQIAKSALVLLDHPDELAKLRARPDLWPTAVDELLRYIPLGAGNGLPLEALEDVELSGVLIRAGDYVITSPAAANFDATVFGDAERLDVTRADNPHFGLGHGAHYCLGANLARMELHVALQSLFERFPAIRPAIPLEEVQWRADSAIWGVASLPVLLG